MSKGRILVVDDDPDILVLMSHLLGGEEYEVATVENSVGAYENIMRFSPEVILLDLYMPGTDGEELLDKIKASNLTRNIPVVIISGLRVPELIRRCLEKGAEDYIVKPFHHDVLIGRIAKVMERQGNSEKVHKIIERYLGPSVAEMIVDRPEQVKLNGMRRRIVSMFVDIRGFTYVVELMEPEDVVALLNRIFTDLAAAVFTMGGAVDKYLGDGLMAFWGAPMANENMEELAIEAALLMMEKVRAFNEERKYPGGLEVRLGIGISEGNAVVGNIGSEKRTDYTVIGESVNIASRLEKMARPGQILITEDICKKIGPNFTCVDIGEFQLKGKTMPVRVFEVVS